MNKVLVDADVLVYRSAFSTEGMSQEDAEHKVEEVLDEIMEHVLFSPNPDLLQLYLTGANNFRYDMATIAPYKGNRSGKEKPEHFYHLRGYLVDHWGAEVSEGEEADDLIAKAATKQGPTSIIVSVDKDFLQVPCTFFNLTKREFIKVDEQSGMLFFYTQVLTGDRADNIKGVPNVGPVKAKRILEGLTTEQELYEACLETYDGDAEALLENARLLWLRREEDELWFPPDQR